MGYFTIGLILGLIVMGLICRMAYRQELEWLKMKISNDRQCHFNVVQSMEGELRMLRDVVRTMQKERTETKKEKDNGKTKD